MIPAQIASSISNSAGWRRRRRSSSLRTNAGISWPVEDVADNTQVLGDVPRWVPAVAWIVVVPTGMFVDRHAVAWDVERALVPVRIEDSAGLLPDRPEVRGEGLVLLWVPGACRRQLLRVLVEFELQGEGLRAAGAGSGADGDDGVWPLDRATVPVSALDPGLEGPGVDMGAEAALVGAHHAP